MPGIRKCDIAIGHKKCAKPAIGALDFSVRAPRVYV
jgi:hypothetical protein